MRTALSRGCVRQSNRSGYRREMRQRRSLLCDGIGANRPKTQSSCRATSGKAVDLWTMRLRAPAGLPWTYMDAPRLQGSRALLANRRRLQSYIRPSVARGASALMEYAGWVLYKSSSSKLAVHVRFDQPRSYLCCHQRSIAKATCGSSSSKACIRRRLLRDRRRRARGLINLARGQHRPGEPCVLVGHCHRRDVVVSPSHELAKPRTGPITARPGQLHQRAATVDQQRSQVHVPSLADAQQHVLAPAGVLMRHQPDPGSELARVLEVAGVSRTGRPARWQ